MIKKIFGMLLAAAILALLVLTVLHHDNYRSMIWDGADFGPAAAVAEPVAEPVAASENTGPGPDRQSCAAPARPPPRLRRASPSNRPVWPERACLRPTRFG